MKTNLVVLFLVVEAVNGFVVYQHQELLSAWQGWALLAVPVAMALVGLLLPWRQGASPARVEQETQDKGDKGPGEDREEKQAPSEQPADQVAPQDDTGEAAIQLLSVLQHEGRLVDFLMEDISPYPDQQVGAAAREVHDKCRKAVEEIFGLRPVLSAEEGSRVEVDEGFDPAKIRLVGRLGGGPPYKGVLLHAGWRCTRVALPPGKGKEGIVAPAEVEV